MPIDPNELEPSQATSKESQSNEILPSLELEPAGEREQEVLTDISRTLVSTALQAMRSTHNSERQAAYNLITDLLAAREKYVLALAKLRNPDIHSINEQTGLYQSGENGIYGSLWALMDATPATHQHATLANAVSVGHLGSSEVADITSISGESVAPRALIESSVHLAGSGAQNRVQEFATDLDFSETVRINCETVEDAKTLLAQRFATMFGQPRQVVGQSGQATQLIPRQIWVSEHHNPGENIDGRKWLPHEVAKGYKRYYDAHEKLQENRFDDALVDSRRVVVEFMAVNGEEVFGVSQIVSLEAIDSTGNRLFGTTHGESGCFQDVYFDSPEEFGLDNSTNNPDQLLNYLAAMSKQIDLVERRPKPDSLKVMKRLYNFNKAVGNFEAVAAIEELFIDPICHIYQLTKRIPLAIEVSEQTGNPRPLRNMLSQLQSLLENSALPIPPQIQALFAQRANASAVHQIVDQVNIQIVEPAIQQFLAQHPSLQKNLQQVRNFN